MDWEKYMKERLERTSFGQAAQKTMQVISKNKVVLAISIIISLLVGWKLSTILFKPFRPIQLGVFLIASLLVEYCLAKVVLTIYKPYTIEREEDRRINISDTGEKGTARFMGREEAESAFTIKTIAEQKDNIVGASRENGMDELYATKEQYGINGNSIYVGSPGSGKTRCLGIPQIFQTIRRRESMIITDPKGELFMYTAKMAKAHGYTVKILNLDPAEMVHSDSFNYMSVIGNDDLKATVFANTIIENTSDGKEDNHWKSQALNLLKCLVLVVNTYHEELGLERRLSSIYKLITDLSLADFEARMKSTIKPNHPARSVFNSFSNGPSAVKESVYGSMGVRLSIFNNPIVQQITGIDDIDITLPGREPCLYFLSMSDQEHSMNFLVALFFSLYFQENVAFANAQPDKKLPVKTWILLDEFFSIGKIPDFDQKLSNLRSRAINCSIIIQDITQLQAMYPENLWQTVVNCCSAVILLQTGAAPETAKFFSDRTGVMTVVDKSIRYGDSALNVVKNLNDIQVTETKVERKVMTPDEIQRMSPFDELVTMSTKNAIKLKKYDFLNHPMTKEITETLASNHLPQWYMDMSETDKALLGIPEIVDGEILTGDGVELCTDWDFEHPACGNKREEKGKSLIQLLHEASPFELTSEDMIAEDEDYDAEEEDDEIEVVPAKPILQPKPTFNVPTSNIFEEDENDEEAEDDEGDTDKEDDDSEDAGFMDGSDFTL